METKSKAEHWRSRAAEALAVAEEMIHPETKATHVHCSRVRKIGQAGRGARGGTPGRGFTQHNPRFGRCCRAQRYRHPVSHA
jgi:hypothetical protein